MDGVTKLTRLDSRIHDPLSAMSDGADYRDSLYAESLRKMLVAMAEDIRVVLIKLADRLHNMKTLDALPSEKQRRIAQETLDIYSPLAHRLGIWEIKWQLDDLAFRHLDIDKYREISRMLSARRVEREEYVERVSDELRLKLDTEDIKAEVSGRPKNIYSTYRKIQKYEAEGKMLSDIYDLFALRVLVEKEIDCYRVLGVVHQLWHPIPGQIDDYISNAKENGYQALHTTVLCEGGTHLEVQIKTVDMHQVAEYGVAAHWRYKEGKTSDVDFEEKMSELRQLLEWQRDVTSTAEFIESVKQDILRDQVFVYTPKGRIVELTAGSTPVDFAYKIHTELGHRCVGAKVNGRLVSLDTPLQNGDTVEIMSTKSDRGPSLDWLNPNRGYVRSAGARQSIRQWFNRQKRETNIRRGREILRREMRRLNQKFDDSEVLALFKHDTMDELLVNLGSGGVAESQLAQKLVEARQEPEHPLARKRTDHPAVQPHFWNHGAGRGRYAHPDGPLLQSHSRRRDSGLCHPVARCYRSQARLSQREAGRRAGTLHSCRLGQGQGTVSGAHHHGRIRPRWLAERPDPQCVGRGGQHGLGEHRRVPGRQGDHDPDRLHHRHGAVGKAVRQAGGHPRLHLGPPRAFFQCRRLPSVILVSRPCLSCSYPVKMQRVGAGLKPAPMAKWNPSQYLA